MSQITLTIIELASIVSAAVLLSATNAAAISDIGVAYVSKKLGVSPGDIRSYDSATGDSGGEAPQPSTDR